jgi:hypothetical protein
MCELLHTSLPNEVRYQTALHAEEASSSCFVGKPDWERPLLLNEEAIRGGSDSWENLRNLLKRNGQIWHQLGK